MELAISTPACQPHKSPFIIKTLLFFLTFLATAVSLNAQPAKEESIVAPKYLGAASCSSANCHGGGGETRSQHTVWLRLDFHHRTYATLANARSARLAEVLKLGEPAQSTRCTVCHAPFHEVPETQRAPNIRSTDGVSCENCHGPAEAWLRTHTRPDLSHAERVQTGMRDLQNLYVRANTCIACHQTVDTDLLAAGHPELIFDLDGQAVSQPKHWRERAGWSGAQTWLVGQAAALREMSWQMANESAPNEKLTARWNGLLWLLQKTTDLEGASPSLKAVPLEPTADNLAQARKSSDELARRAAALEWSHETTRKYLTAFANSYADFKEKTPARPIQARRAERLVLALDRLVVSLDKASSVAALDSEVNQLYKLVQSLPDFNPAQFAGALERFSQMLNQSASR